QDGYDAVALFLRDTGIERDDGPVGLTLREVSAHVRRDPEPRVLELDCARMPAVDPEGEVGPAKVLDGAMMDVTGRLGGEVALAEHRAATGLDDGGIERPVFRGLSGAVRNAGGSKTERPECNDESVHSILLLKTLKVRARETVAAGAARSHESR